MPTDPLDCGPQGSALEFRLLGGMETYFRGQPINLGSTKHRLFIAVLMAADGRPVPAERLIDQIWDDDPPATARDLLYSYVSDLRGSLDAAEPGTGRLLPPYEVGYRVL